VTDGILVDAARHWRSVEVLDDGEAVRFQPGVIAAAVNRTLAPYQKKIGPDPASINACMMGGVLANNSSGMCCGVELNAYHTLKSMVFVLPDGTTIDSAADDCEERFLAEVSHIAAGLLDLRDRVRGDTSLCERIRHKYRMKNTMGYALNAFLDYDAPVAMLSHLMIGSEGTLGFIAEAVLKTVPDYPLKHTGMLFFDDVPLACSAIVPLRPGSPTDRGRAAGRVSGPHRGRALRFPHQLRRRDAGAGDAVGAHLHQRPGPAKQPVVGPQGPHCIGRRRAKAGDLDDHRGRGLPARGPGRGCGGPPGPFLNPPLRRCDHLRPRQGRQPPFRPQPGFRR
jgi:FAD/FMN-containing dehydrogenase